MRKFAALSRIFRAMAVLLACVMCALVAYRYCALEWGGRYAGWSAPPATAFLYAIPFAAGIAACILLAKKFRQA